MRGHGATEEEAAETAKLGVVQYYVAADIKADCPLVSINLMRRTLTLAKNVNFTKNKVPRPARNR